MLTLLTLASCTGEPVVDSAEPSRASSSEITVVLHLDEQAVSTETLVPSGVVTTDQGATFFGLAEAPAHALPLAQVASAQFSLSCALDIDGAALCFNPHGFVLLPSLGTGADPAVDIAVEYDTACTVMASGELRCLRQGHSDIDPDQPAYGWEDGEPLVWQPPSPAQEVAVGLTVAGVLLEDRDLWTLEIGWEELEPSLTASQVAMFDVDFATGHDVQWVGLDGSASEQVPVDPERIRGLSRIGCAAMAGGEVHCWFDDEHQVLDLDGPAVDVDGLTWHGPDPDHRSICALHPDDSVSCVIEEAAE